MYITYVCIHRGQQHPGDDDASERSFWSGGGSSGKGQASAEEEAEADEDRRVLRHSVILAVPSPAGHGHGAVATPLTHRQAAVRCVIDIE